MFNGTMETMQRGNIQGLRSWFGFGLPHEPAHRAFRRAERQVGAGRDRDFPLGRMMSERRWRVTARGRGLFAIEVDDGGGFRAATAAEVDAALRQRELFGAADYPVQRVDAAERPGDDVDVG